MLFNSMTIPQTLSARTVIILTFLICILLSAIAYLGKSHPSYDYDEGVYFTTFKMIEHGFPLYKTTFHSQLPGFFILTYPFYLLLGSTLEAARLGIAFFALVGIAAIIWLFWELKSVITGFVAVGLLYLVPVYSGQILTLHPGILPLTFSTLALAAMFRFFNTKQYRFIGLSAIFASVATLIKFDITVIPALLLILLYTSFLNDEKKKNLFKYLGIFSLTFIITSLVLTLPFGLREVVNNVVRLRFQAAETFPFDPAVFWGFLKRQYLLIGLLISAILLNLKSFKDKNKLLPAVLGIWTVTATVMLFVYHPLQYNHMGMLAVPITTLFAYSISKYIKDIKLSKSLFAVIGLLSLMVFFIPPIQKRANRIIRKISLSVTSPEIIPDQIQAKGVALIQQYTQNVDYIVTDDGIVTGLSNRPTPPFLVDLSGVRINSGNITTEDFKQNIDVYKPKLVMVWAGRLTGLPDFENIMNQYHYRLLEDSDLKHKAYILEQ